MKQSIMGRSSLHERGQIKPKETQKDFRVDNIDKINAKIKQILDCLHEGETKPRKDDKIIDTPQTNTPLAN